MKPIDARKAISAATSKGFRAPSERGGKRKRTDHYYLFYHDPQQRKTTWRIKISHGADEIKPGHIRSDALVCDIPPDEMLNILNCVHDKAWVDNRYLAQRTAQQGAASPTRQG